jgi:colanic acid biosynthesis glycosyl transferase WcaI
MRTSLNILLLNQTFYPDNPATAQHTLDLALFLAEKGHKVSVICGDRAYENRQRRFSKYETYRGIEIHRVSSTGFGKRSFLHRLVDALTFDLSLLWKLTFFKRQDIVCSFTSPPLIGIFGMFHCWLHGGSFVQWLMDINPEAAIAVGYIKRDSGVAKFLLSVFRLTLRRSKYIVVLDRWMKETVKAHGIPAERVKIIPPWPVQDIELTPTRAVLEDNPLRREYDLEGKFVVMYSGNHSIVHPVATLLEAARKLQSDQDVRFVFIGGGLRVQEVSDFVKTHQLKNVIQLPHQPRERLKSSLGLANLHVVIMGEAVTGLVHASKIYGVLATGTPAVAVAPRQSHLVDLRGECNYGFHVEHGDVAGLVSAIKQAQGLGSAELDAHHFRNIEYVKTRYSLKASMAIVVREILEDHGDPEVSLPLKAGQSSVGS